MLRARRMSSKIFRRRRPTRLARHLLVSRHRRGVHVALQAEITRRPSASRNALANSVKGCAHCFAWRRAIVAGNVSTYAPLPKQWARNESRLERANVGAHHLLVLWRRQRSTPTASNVFW